MFTLFVGIVCFIAGGYFFKAVFGWTKQKVQQAEHAAENLAHSVESKITKK